jgi:hypothetical protein
MTPDPKRRWLRFSLQTLFVMIAIAALAIVTLAIGGLIIEWMIVGIHSG